LFTAAWMLRSWRWATCAFVTRSAAQPDQRSAPGE
jgi:hypothetical protein